MLLASNCKYIFKSKKRREGSYLKVLGYFLVTRMKALPFPILVTHVSHIHAYFNPLIIHKELISLVF